MFLGFACSALLMFPLVQALIDLFMHHTRVIIAMHNALNEEFWKTKSITKKSVESVVNSLEYGQCKRRPEQYASTKHLMTFDADFDYIDEMPRIGRNVHMSDPLPVFDADEVIPPGGW